MAESAVSAVSEQLGGAEVAVAEAAIRDLAKQASTLDDASLAARALGFEYLRRVLAATEAGVMAAWDASQEWALDGHGTAKTALAHRAGLANTAAGDIIRRARKLPRLDAVAAALTQGRISVTLADMFCRTAAASRYGPALENDQDMLVSLAGELNHEDFCRAFAHWKRCVDPDGPQPGEIAGELQVYKHPDGRVTVRGDLDAIDGATFDEALHRIERELFLAEWEQAKAQWGDQISADRLARSPAQRRAAALAEMARRSQAVPEGAKAPEPLIVVVTDQQTIDAVIEANETGGPLPTLDFETSVCELLDRTPISVRQLIDLILLSPIDRSLIAITVGPSSQPSFTGHLRRVLDLRDRHCRWPGCHQPAQRCQGDHVTPRHQGGPTSLENGQLLCGRHNRLKDPPHGPRFEVTRTSLEEFCYRRPDGTPIPTTSTLGQSHGGDDPP
ncbi:MAG: DUF222 domain-containing protein [Actinomycetia bacterium]|nr:DUF222 domain-containing protein [Actinomycetes bacterium]